MSLDFSLPNIGRPDGTTNPLGTFASTSLWLALPHHKMRKGRLLAPIAPSVLSSLTKRADQGKLVKPVRTALRLFA
jgi:hypothetical protein